MSEIFLNNLKISEQENHNFSRNNINEIKVLHKIVRSQIDFISFEPDPDQQLTAR